MKRENRQLRKNARQLKVRYFVLLSVTIFSLLFFIAVDGKAADPSATYPSRPIDLVVHGAPGGSADTMGRLISDIVQKEKILSQPLVVLNKQGSGGAVAMGYLLEKKGNPHTVLIVPSSTYIVTILTEKLPYDLKSFTPVANLVADGCVLVVRSDSPFKNIEDLIAEAKKRPKQLIQSGASFASNDSMMGRSIQKLKGVQWNFLSFASEPEAILNVLSGTAHFAFPNPSGVIDHVRAGKLRVILAGAPNRYPDFKDVPTIKEAGLGDPIVTCRGIVGPPNMPDYAARRIEAVFKKVVETDRFKKFVNDSMLQPVWMSAGEYSQYLYKETDLWKVRLSELDLLKKK